MIAPLTGVRAFAALWVIFHHLRLSIELIAPSAEGLQHFLGFGYLGVDLFAFLSGFVIAYNYAERIARGTPREVGRYLWLRAVRIFPLHWFMLAVLALAVAVIPNFGTHPLDAGRYQATDFVQHALMVHGWGFAPHYAWDMPSWTVSAEWLCYLAFPLVAAALLRIRDAAVAFACAGISVGATAVVLRALGYPDFSASLWWGALRIAGEFLAGALLFRAWQLGFARRAPWGVIAVAAFGAAVALTRWSGAAVAIVACFGIGVLALAHGRGPLCWLLARRPVVFLGEISYSIYLAHWVVLRILENVRPDLLAGTPWARSRLGDLVICVGLILAASVATYYGVESPARRGLRRFAVPARSVGQSREAV